jgi:WD40 repeat protein
VAAVAVTPDGKHVVSFGDDLKYKLWDAKTGADLRTRDGTDKVLLMASLPDSKQVAIWYQRLGSSDDDVTHNVQRVEVATLAAGEILADRGRRVSCLCFSADGELAGMGGPDGSVRIWNIPKKERVNDSPKHAKPLGDVAFTPDKTRVIAGDQDGEVRVWNLKGEPNPRTFKTAAAGLGGLACSPDGKRVAALGAGGVVDVCEIETGRSLRKWALGTDVVSIAFTPDGRGLVTANKDSTLYLLELP